MSEAEFEEIRKKLLQERTQLLAHAAESGPPRHMNPDRDDLVQDYVALEQDIALQAIEREQLNRINSALQRIEDGTYGICTSCGRAIPGERLQVLPYATLCVSCQSQQEKRW